MNREKILGILRDTLIEVSPPGLFRRPMFSLMKNLQEDGTFSKDIVIVEIGSDLGINALNICRSIKFKHLYLVDPYLGGYGHCDTGDERCMKAKKILGKKDNVTWLRVTSEEASNTLDDNIDVVYIDGNHTYPYVKQDIELWYPKVKKNGIIGGHDFCSTY